MREAFRFQKISVKREAQIIMANEILEEYAGQGYRLTLRQLYYQLVARDQIPNLVKEYQKLSQTVVMGRMNGLIDWNMIEDRIRLPHLEYSVDSIQEAIEDTISQYKRNRQEGQPQDIEIWTEKDAVSNILKRVSTTFHLRLMVNRGYSSCSAMYEASKRFRRKTVILYVGDHDPSGLDMLRDIRDRLEEFETDDFKLIPVALTMEQIQEYKPPPNPAKISDPRAGWYIREFGIESWELDALRPDVLEKIVNNAVTENINLGIYTKMLEKEAEDRLKLREMIEDL